MSGRDKRRHVWEGPVRWIFHEAHHASVREREIGI
jgi:hypothetical protein